MMNMINRRQFLQITGGGAAGLLAGGLPSLINIEDARAASNPEGKFIPDIDIALKASPAEIPILPGNPTSVWSYQAQLLKGNPASLIQHERTYLGPTIRARTGQKVRNRAGTYWYHPHPHGITGPQVYGGLAGLFLVSDDEEKAAELPTGNYDIPLVIQDRAFDNRNQLIFLSGNHMEQMTGFLGDWIMVNGQPDFRMQEVANDEKVCLNTLEVWEFINEGGGMGMMRNYLIESTAASV